MADRDIPHTSPGWVKILGALAVVIVATVIVLHLAGISPRHVMP